MRQPKELVQRLAAAFGYVIQPLRPPFLNADPGFAEVDAGLEAFTMTSVERRHALYQAVRHVTAAKIPGAIVECGVWRGGSMMLACRTLLAAGERDRELYLFDTYAGMTPPSERDVDAHGRGASALMAESAPSGARDSIWCVATEEDVRANLATTAYPQERLHLVKGRVEETLPARAPERIALLRLDTDWYESTRHELEHLLPRVQDGGVLIVDDYGHWRGAREAVDEALAARQPPILLQRTDETGRMGIVRAAR